MQGEANPPGRGGGDRARNIVRGIGSLSIQGIVSALLGLVFLGTLLRFLPSVTYGAYSGLQVTLGIAAVLSIFGFNAAAVRFLASATSSGEDSGWGAAKASLVLAMVLSALVSLFLIVTAPYLSDYFMKSPSWAWIFYLGALWLFTSSVATLLQSMLQAARKYSLLAKVLLASKFISVTFAVVGVVVYQSLAAAILSWVVFFVLVSVAPFAVFWRTLLAASSRHQYGRVLRYAAPLGVAGIIGVVSSSADIVVVGGYLDPVSLGV